jgi:hypothetical protein
VTPTTSVNVSPPPTTRTASGDTDHLGERLATTHYSHRPR